jgi:glycosyltransferase involved in cell wall biosynthesis
MSPANGSGRVRISVVVPVRDDQRIDDLLVSLAAQDGAPKFEVLVALDGSRREPRIPPGIAVRLIALPPRGAYAARNSAIRLAEGDLILLTDSDCVCPPDWLAASCRAFEDPSLAALQGASRAYEDSRLSRLIQLEYDRIVDSAPDRAQRHFCNTRNFGIRASLAQELPFPEAFPRGGDAVYGRLLEKTGIAIRYEPSWWIAHRHPSSRLEEGRRAFEQGRDGALWTRELGLDLFASANGRPPRGPGAWLLSHTRRSNVLRRAASVALLPVAGVFSVLSAVLPDAAGARAFSRFRRAAHLAGRLYGESKNLGRKP